ncbi:hypothetical protein D3C78_645910 [compost metagenome]
MPIASEDLDQNGLVIGVSPERFREVAMPLLELAGDALALLQALLQAQPWPACTTSCRCMGCNSHAQGCISCGGEFIR